MGAVVEREIELPRIADSSRARVCIGVLALQGDFQKHLQTLGKISSADAHPVRTSQEIEECDGLIIPGGESTTVGKLMARCGLDRAIKRRHAEGMAVFGTCTGMILLAKEIEGSDQHRLGLMDVTVRRNAFGRQVDSFEADLSVPSVCDDTIRAVFIRAPIVTKVGSEVQALATLDTGEVVMVRQGNCLAAAFHPELTEDTRIHEYFALLAADASPAS